MKAKISLLICCTCFGTASAQTLRYSVTIPWLGLDAYSGKQLSAFSFTANQAALARTKEMSLGLFGEQRFLLASDRSYRLAGVCPTRLGNIGLQFNYAGFKNFNEYQVGLAYARSLGPKADLGIQFSYYGNRIPGYSGNSGIQVEGGVIFHITGQVHMGIHGFSSFGGKNSQEKTASVYKAGLGYDASPQFFAAMELVKEEDRPVNVVALAQYRFARLFAARLGFSSSTGSPFLGTGLGWKNYQLFLSVSYHPQLGISPGFLLLIQKPVSR